MSEITVLDDLLPEDVAMLQALYSRSPARVREHLEKVKASGSGKFMGQFYVGYGHRSIGDCGTTSIFIEDVSMLAAKAIQDWPLYSGQEASTRYMDFSKARIEDPIGTEESATVQRSWMEFYHAAQEPMLEHLHTTYPRSDDEDEKVYERAIRARCFDVLRAFLPAGATTNLSWHTNLRQAADHLQWLEAHPDPLIARLGLHIRQSLAVRYPNSFSRTSDVVAAAYRSVVMERYNYLDQDPAFGSDSYISLGDGSGVYANNGIARDRIREYDVALFRARPPKTELPHFLADLGQIWTQFLLDFGSFRDLQRHRNGTVRMPLLTLRHGFHPWYLDQLPPTLRVRAESLVATQTVRIEAMTPANVRQPWIRQYYVAMGFRVSCQVTQSLSGFVYRLELRTDKSVHPTLRRVVQAEAKWFAAALPMIPIYANMEPDSWDIRRGKQTIEERV